MIKKNKQKTMNNRKNGFTLFIAVVVMSILLLISFAIVSIAFKEIILSSAGKSSQDAFYASDVGLECALYWDFKGVNGSAFATSTANSIQCYGNTISGNSQLAGINGYLYSSRIGGGGKDYPTSIFQLNLDETFCVIVSVNKDYDDAGPITRIESRGYNTCDTTNPRRVERAVRITY